MTDVDVAPHRHDLEAEFGRFGCGTHEHDGTPAHYHYVSGARIDWHDGRRHRSVAVPLEQP